MESHRLRNLGAFVRQCKELGQSDLMGAELLQHPAIAHAMVEGDDDCLLLDLRNGVSDIAESLDEQSSDSPFAWLTS